MDFKSVVHPDYDITSCQELNDVINQVLCFIIRDYIQDWYNSLTPDRSFPVEIHKTLLTLVSNIVKRISQVDWVPFLTEVIPSQLASHIRLYRIMLERKPSYTDKSSIKLFFDAEFESERNVCREDICCSRDKELDHLRKIAERFLFFVTPLEEYRVPLLRYFARELLVNSIVLPVIDLLSTPDFVNQVVSWFAYDSTYTSEYYCQALRMSESTEELEVVIHELDKFMIKLRGHDTGGENDASIKAQLGSLDFVKKICFTRLNQIKEGVAEKPENLLAYHLQPGVKLYDMTFDELMSKSVGVVSFLEFLTSIGKQNLLQLYLNCMSFRESVINLANSESLSNANLHSSILALVNVASSMENISCSTDLEVNSCLSSDELFDSDSLTKSEQSPTSSTDNTNADTTVAINDETENGHTANDDCDVVDCDDEDDDVDDCVANNEPNYQDDSGAIEQLRAFGITLCSNLLHYLPLSVESSIQHILRTLTTQDRSPSPDTFTEIEKYLVDMLAGPQYLGEFKRTSHYVCLLGEMDLLKEPVDQFPSSNSSTNSMITGGMGNNTTCLSTDEPVFVNSASSSVSNSTDQATNTNNLDVSSSMWNESHSIVTNRSNDLPDSKIGTAQLGKNSNSASLSVSNSRRTSFANGIFTAEIIGTKIVRDLFTVYALRVNYKSTTTGETSTWNTLRRFRHFVELLSHITARCGRIPGLKLPSKIAFNNMSRDVLAQRRRGLNLFLATLCNPELLAARPMCRPLVVEFLKPTNWERVQGQGQFVSAILAPLKSVGNAVLSVPDTLADGLNKIFTGKSFSIVNNANSINLTDDLAKRSNEFEMEVHSDLFLGESTKLGASDSVELSGDETPLRLLFQLVDEIFDLHQRSLLIRQGNFAIIRKFVQTFFGFRVNKMIIAKVIELTSAPKIAQLITHLRDYLWPPADAPKISERDKQMKLRTRVLCRTMLLGSISEELAQFLGNETRRRGVARVFNLLQEECLNRRFIHLILESFLCELFKPYQAHWEGIYEADLCPLKTGRQCRSHKTAPNT